jgi:hypothetical protein
MHIKTLLNAAELEIRGIPCCRSVNPVIVDAMLLHFRQFSLSILSEACGREITEDMDLDDIAEGSLNDVELFTKINSIYGKTLRQVFENLVNQNDKT